MTQQSYVHIRLRRDLGSNWTLNNPILRVGEPGLETDTRKLKFGDGVTPWRNLPYSGIDINDALLLENIDDRVANLIRGGSNILVSYNDNSNELTISATGLQLAGDYAALVNGRVPAIQLPSYVDDVLEFNNLSSLPASGESGKIYVTLDSNKTYRWSGSSYVEISASPGSTDAVPEGAVNKYYTDNRASAAAPVQSVAGKTGSVTLTKNDVGLGNVDNTSDLDKPVSQAVSLLVTDAYSACIMDATTKANAAQAYAIQRANHTGSQAISTVDGLQTALDLKLNSSEVNTDLVAGPGISLVYSSPNNSLSISCNNENYITALGTLSGSNAINYDPSNRSIQTLTLNGNSVTFTKGTGWPTSSSVSVDTILQISVTSATSITWTIVNDWFNQPSPGALGVGIHLFLLREIGFTIQGHYIGSKTN